MTGYRDALRWHGQHPEAPAPDPIWYNVLRWHHQHPEARFFPPHIANDIEKLERRHMAETADIRVSLDPYQLEEIRADLDAESIGWRKRRDAEEQLAAYIREVDDATGWRSSRPGARSLLELADDLEGCRRQGAVGLKPDGGTMIAWEQKCGQVHLCPDESREETQRLAEFYLPGIMEWLKAKPTRRLFYSVFTVHNFRPGQLHTGKKYLFDRFNEWRQYRPHACPVSFRTRHGITEVIRSRRQYMDAPYQLEGALVIQEDPLSAHDDWNVHLNAFLMVDGQFSYQTAREVWGGNVHFQEVKGDAPSIRKALLEAIKYSARLVPEKSAMKAAPNGEDSANSDVGDSGDGGGNGAAPAMTQWPHRRWIEWWSAQQAFRRVRSFGALYALHGKRWEAADAKQRVVWCSQAQVGFDAAAAPWADLSEEQKNPIRRAMVHGERLDMSLVEWIGTVSACPDGSLWVDLIPGNNFSGSATKRTSRGGNPSTFSTGPPGPPH